LDVDLKQLEHFVAVAEERHFTRAAQRLRISQSTISASIQALEREAGLPLFARTSRRVELTTAGQALLPEARRTLSAAEAGRAAIAAVAGGLSGKVAVGTGKALPIAITDALARFAADHPGIEVELRQAGSMELIEAVGDGRLDFAPLGIPGALPDHLSDRVNIVEVSVEPMLFACAASHRFAERKSVRLADIADERFADFGEDWAIRIVNDRAFAEIRRVRRVGFEVNDVDALLDLVGLGLAVAVVPQSVCNRPANVRYVKLSGRAPTWRIGVAVPAGRPPSPAARSLLATMIPGVEWPSD
jgi:DNA-binding transcriptional LysR family regulator